MRKACITGLTAAALMGVGLGFANPAQAATFSYAVDCAIGGATQSVTAATGDTITLTVGAGTCQYVSVEKSIIASSSAVTITGGGSPTANDGGVYWEWNGTSAITQVVISLTITGTGQINFIAGGSPFSTTGQAFNVSSGGGGGGSSSSGPTSQPQPVALSINTVDGSSCRQSSESGIAGTWMNLPGADDCTAPATKPGATLLGWATDANFPVEIAQRQIDNGWGAYEMFNDEGRLTAVFIPAGGATFLSGDGNLFAIWSE